MTEKYDKDETNVCQWELYNEEKKKFWKEQSMKSRNFRGKVIHKLFKDVIDYFEEGDVINSTLLMELAGI